MKYICIFWQSVDYNLILMSISCTCFRYWYNSNICIRSIFRYWSCRIYRDCKYTICRIIIIRSVYNSVFRYWIYWYCRIIWSWCMFINAKSNLYSCILHDTVSIDNLIADLFRIFKQVTVNININICISVLILLTY